MFDFGPRPRLPRPDPFQRLPRFLCFFGRQGIVGIDHAPGLDEHGVLVISTSDAPGMAASEPLVLELSAFGLDALKRPEPDTASKSPWVWVNVEPRPFGPQGEAKLRMQKKQTGSHVAK